MLLFLMHEEPVTESWESLLSATMPVERCWPGRGLEELSTPLSPDARREVLLWLPELQVDERGEGTVEVPLPDDISSWSIVAVASSPSGQLAIAEEELVTAQGPGVE